MSDYAGYQQAWSWATDQAERYEASGGTEATTIHGKPIVVMTTIGVKSGLPRKTCLMRVEHDGQYAAVASAGGQRTHPTWYYNVKANPNVVLRDATVVREYVVRELFDTERSLWWRRSVAAWSGYVRLSMATSRQFPIFVLEPR